MHPQRHRKMQRIPNRTHELQRDHRAPYPAIVSTRTLGPLILIYPRRCPRLLKRRPGKRVVAAYTGREEDDCAAEKHETQNAAEDHRQDGVIRPRQHVEME